MPGETSLRKTEPPKARRQTSAPLGVQLKIKTKEIDMTTHINGIVQITRQLHGKTGAEYTELMTQRYDRVLAAIKDGIDPDLLSWAIEINDEPAKVQAQYVIAHTMAAIALQEQETD